MMKELLFLVGLLLHACSMIRPVSGRMIELSKVQRELYCRVHLLTGFTCNRDCVWPFSPALEWKVSPTRFGEIHPP